MDNPLFKTIPEKNCDITIKFEPRPYQIEPSNNIFNHLIKNLSCVCSLHTGWGKTWLALWLADKLKLKTLIIVHTKSLMDQWIENIEKYTNKVGGIIKSDKIILNDITVASIQSLCKRDYGDIVNKGFDFTVYDEVHHIPCKLFSSVFFKLSTTYSLGISATVDRVDGLSGVINWFLGETVVNIKSDRYIPEINVIKLNTCDIITPIYSVDGSPNMMAMINKISEINERNNIIVKYCEINADRNILILTHTRTHVEKLSSIIKDSGKYMGGMTIEDLKISNSKRIIIGTYSMASEGYDNPKLDTLIFATPKSNIEQSIGRILRQKNKNDPLVIDIYDDYSMFNSIFTKRQRFYKKNNYNVNIEHIVLQN